MILFEMRVKTWRTKRKKDRINTTFENNSAVFQRVIANWISLIVNMESLLRALKIIIENLSIRLDIERKIDTGAKSHSLKSLKYTHNENGILEHTISTVIVFGTLPDFI